MNAKNGKKPYLIITTRTEYQRCRYLVGAQSVEQASLLFEQGRAACVEANVIDAEEDFEEILLDKAQAAVTTGSVS